MRILTTLSVLASILAGFLFQVTPVNAGPQQQIVTRYLHVDHLGSVRQIEVPGDY